MEAEIAAELIKSGREEETIISANFESLTDDFSRFSNLM